MGDLNPRCLRNIRRCQPICLQGSYLKKLYLILKKKGCQVANIAANRWLLKIKTKYFHFRYGMALYFFGK